ncbi:hypothetical protein [Sphingomonas jatrophae]|uniref:Uncharacterized protein n=1 Tax=Sphingomonas jatrophae TaxID=1166337 RepID=A0A1I6K0X0_9SPHN|nr:hypothetical protein [Sphingomonas jatrophae]SFR84748.1 hypothetical protein SAMN05192580_1173 [Sphingomonas jatrophae]
MKTLGQIVGLCLLITALQLAVTGFVLLLATCCVLAFVARPREGMLVLLALGVGHLTITYPLPVFGGLACLAVVGWIVRWRRLRRAAPPPLLLPPPSA